MDDMLEEADGKQDTLDCTIRIKKCLPQSQKEVTLLHELLHCINNQMAEKDIEFLAQALGQVLIDNNLLK
jgi:hypothetical protein